MTTTKTRKSSESSVARAFTWLKNPVTVVLPGYAFVASGLFLLGLIIVAID